jgi:ribosomal protein S18 acetylase RimI-like enzyme
MLRELDGRQFLASLEACAGVYAAAMNPPAEQMPGRHVIMQRHAGYAAFRAIAAIVPGGAADGAGPLLIGFAYGFHGSGGQWWHDLVSSAAASMLGARAADDWFRDSLEIAEVHVLPGYQGRGTGKAMMLRLTAGRPERAAVLSTVDADTRARRLYHGLGFTDLLTGFEFPGTDLPYAIMGAPLPLREAPAGSARPGKPSRW